MNHIIFDYIEMMHLSVIFVNTLRFKFYWHLSQGSMRYRWSQKPDSMSYITVDYE